MPNDRTGDIQINVPTTTPATVQREIEGFVVGTANNPNALESFREAVTNAGLNNPPANQNSKPPYLLIGGALLLSYFLFFK